MAARLLLIDSVMFVEVKASQRFESCPGKSWTSVSTELGQQEVSADAGKNAFRKGSSSYGELAADGQQRLSIVDAGSSVCEAPVAVATGKGTATINPGSAGHPHICRRPCNFSSKGACWRGAEQCGFCHLPHEGQIANIGTCFKELLRAMCAAERNSLLASVFQEGLDEMRLEPECAQLLQGWRDLAGDIASPEKVQLTKVRGFSPSATRRLIADLRQVNLSVLFGVMRTTCGHSKLVEATGFLLGALRSRAQRS